MSLPQRRRATAIVLAGILALVVLTWITNATSEPLVWLPEGARNEPDATASPEQQALPDRVNESRTAVVAADPSQPVAAPVLRVRLRGLHPKAPWTKELFLKVEGRDEAGQLLDHRVDATPDAEGRCSLPLPAWYHTAQQSMGRIEARDPRYLPQGHYWKGTLDPAQEFAFDVQVIALIEGHVVDTRGNPVVAQVFAFAIRDGEPVEPKLAEANTGEGGRYHLRAPPDVPLLLVAAAMEYHLNGRSPRPHRQMGDSYGMRSDLLPVTRRCSFPVGVVNTEDFALPGATPITGVVRWNNGEPIAKARVGASCGARVLEVSTEAGVRVLPSGAVLPVAQAKTDERGQFVLPSVQRTALDVRLLGLPGALELLDDLPLQTITPPQPCELSVPLPITLRVLHGGVVVPHAEIDFERKVARAGDNGEVAIVTARPLRAQARHDRLQSPWTVIEPRAAGSTIALELAAALGEVAIEFEGDIRVRYATITWRSEDGREGREDLLRDDPSVPFRLFLPPGRCHLTAGPGGVKLDAPYSLPVDGEYMLPVERDVEVGDSPSQITLPARFGGSFAVYATDSSGLYVGGTCCVVDATEKMSRTGSCSRPRAAATPGPVGNCGPAAPTRSRRSCRPASTC